MNRVVFDPLGSLDPADESRRSREPYSVTQWRATRYITATRLSIFHLLILRLKESHVNRPQIQNRSSMSSTPSQNLPIRHSSSRHHSHSVSLGAINPSHRVTRRKSMTSTAVNNAAVIAAAIHGNDEKSHGASMLSNRRSLTLKHNGGVRANESAMTDSNADSMGDSGLIQNQNDDVRFGNDESAIDDGVLAESNTGSNSKARARRASEGAYLSKSESKRASGELRCEQCGKGYKHSSCLTKHLSVCPSSLSFMLPVLGSIVLQSWLACFYARKPLNWRFHSLSIIVTPLLTLSLQMGAYTGMVVHLQTLDFQTPAGAAARSSLSPCWNEPGSFRSSRFC